VRLLARVEERVKNRIESEAGLRAGLGGLVEESSDHTGFYGGFDVTDANVVGTRVGWELAGDQRAESGVFVDFGSSRLVDVGLLEGGVDDLLGSILVEEGRHGRESVRGGYRRRNRLLVWFGRPRSTSILFQTISNPACRSLRVLVSTHRRVRSSQTTTCRARCLHYVFLPLSHAQSRTYLPSALTTPSWSSLRPLFVEGSSRSRIVSKVSVSVPSHLVKRDAHEPSTRPAQLQPDLPPPPIPSTSQTPLIRPFSSSSLSSSKTPKRKSPSLAWSKPFKDDPETKIIQLQARLSESVKERAKLEKEQDTLKRETRHREAALRVQVSLPPFLSILRRGPNRQSRLTRPSWVALLVAGEG
jgi:hypothetical protein